MKSSLKAFVAFAILSNALCLDLGHLFGLRRDWRDLSARQPADPQIIEVVRWRQPVCVVPGPGVPPCLMALRKNQNEYERNSAKGIESNGSKESKSVVTGQKTMKNEVGRIISSEFERGAGYEALKEYCRLKLANIKNDLEIIEALKGVGILNEGDDSSALDSICSSFDLSPKVLSPQVVDTVQVELDSSEGSSARSSQDDFTLNLRSSTPGMEEARISRQGKYLLIAESAKSAAPASRSPPAIYVTKVLNSPVTATLVANNCFPDIGVPLCDEYQETVTIYKDPTVGHAVSWAEEHHHVTVSHDTVQGSVQGFPAENNEQVAKPSEGEILEGDVEENTESLDFWSDPSNPHFGDGTGSSEPQRPPGLLGQAVQHVLSKPGVVGAIPPGVINAIANNPAIIEAFLNAGNSGESSVTATHQTVVTAIKPQIVTNSESSEITVQATTSKPGFISSFLDIQKPAILDNFWLPGFNIFNGSTTARPETTQTENGAVNTQTNGGHFGSGVLGQGPVVEAIQNIIHKPEIVHTQEKPGFQPVLVVQPTKRPGLFEHLWNPAGGFGLFDKISTTPKPATPTTEEPNVFNSEIGGGHEPQPKPTQAPGLFGGLFNNPSGPTAAGEGATDSNHGILAIGSSIFSQHSNKPLIIERPGAKPILVEKPIYVQEKPSGAAGLLNFFIPASNKPLLNVDHEVIKEPVYVYQKPKPVSGILSNVFGNGVALSKPAIFQGWAVFGNSEKKTAEPIQSISESQEAEQGGQDTRATIDQPATSTNIDETSDAVATDSVKSDVIEETPASIVDDIPEAIEVIQTSPKSDAFVEDITDEIDNSEETRKVLEENIAFNDDETSASSLDISTLAAVEDQVQDAEAAVGAKAILEDSENKILEEAESSEEVSEIDNEA